MTVKLIADIYKEVRARHFGAGTEFSASLSIVDIEKDWHDTLEKYKDAEHLLPLQIRYAPETFHEAVKVFKGAWDQVKEATWLLGCLGIDFRVTPIFARTDLDDWAPGSHHFQYKFSRGAAGKRNGLSMVGEYTKGSALVDKFGKPVRPTAGEVLHCLLLDALGADSDFEFWAGDFGYDTDSRKAERIYHACRRVRRDLDSFFNEEEQEQMQLLLGVTEVLHG